jgi:hypothetical protein
MHFSLHGPVLTNLRTFLFSPIFNHTPTYKNANYLYYYWCKNAKHTFHFIPKLLECKIPVVLYRMIPEVSLNGVSLFYPQLKNTHLILSSKIISLDLVSKTQVFLFFYSQDCWTASFCSKRCPLVYQSLFYTNFTTISST